MLYEPIYECLLASFTKSNDIIENITLCNGNAAEIHANSPQQFFLLTKSSLMCFFKNSAYTVEINAQEVCQKKKYTRLNPNVTSLSEIFNQLRNAESEKLTVNLTDPSAISAYECISKSEIKAADAFFILVRKRTKKSFNSLGVEGYLAPCDIKGSIEN